MIYSMSETSREYLLPHCHLQTLTIVDPIEQCAERDTNWDEGQTRVVKDVVLQAHRTPFY
jgi:hypothetical protein